MSEVCTASAGQTAAGGEEFRDLSPANYRQFFSEGTERLLRDPAGPLKAYESVRNQLEDELAFADKGRRTFVLERGMYTMAWAAWEQATVGEVASEMLNNEGFTREGRLDRIPELWVPANRNFYYQDEAAPQPFIGPHQKFIEIMGAWWYSAEQRLIRGVSDCGGENTTYAQLWKVFQKSCAQYSEAILSAREAGASYVPANTLPDSWLWKYGDNPVANLRSGTFDTILPTMMVLEARRRAEIADEHERLKLENARPEDRAYMLTSKAVRSTPQLARVPYMKKKDFIEVFARKARPGDSIDQFPGYDGMFVETKDRLAYPDSSIEGGWCEALRSRGLCRQLPKSNCAGLMDVELRGVIGHIMDNFMPVFADAVGLSEETVRRNMLIENRLPSARFMSSVGSLVGGRTIFVYQR
jgi:hypothetical protein